MVAFREKVRLEGFGVVYMGGSREIYLDLVGSFLGILSDNSSNYMFKTCVIQQKQMSRLKW